MITEARWNVCTADLDPVEGSEQAGRRPVIIISNDDFNRVMPIITVLPLTSLKPGRQIYPSEVLLKEGDANLEIDSLILTHQIRTISKKRIKSLIGAVNDSGKQQEIEAAIKLHLNLFYLAFIMTLIHDQFVRLFNASLLDAMHANPFSA